MIDSQGSATMRILLLGGTTEAGLMARTLADARMDAVYSYAGRTGDPLPQPLPQRRGGFGGTSGLVNYLQAEAVTHVIDATHPFAAQMSHHAVEACTATGTALIALERRPWQPQPGDIWRNFPDLDACLAALPVQPTRIFAAIGRQNLAAFATHPQHRYLLRLVDAPATLPLPDAQAIIARGPFTLESDLDLLKSHGIQLIIAKNSGGTGARAKLDAARALQIPVLLIDRPAIPPRQSVETVAEVMQWLGHPALRGV
jgi:precorrin-6A/cobalt-precorrin-6A reductase